MNKETFFKDMITLMDMMSRTKGREWGVLINMELYPSDYSDTEIRMLFKYTDIVYGSLGAITYEVDREYDSILVSIEDPGGQHIRHEKLSLFLRDFLVLSKCKRGNYKGAVKVLQKVNHKDIRGVNWHNIILDYLRKNKK